MAKKKLLILDRDGTIIVEPPDEQIDSLEKLCFLDGALENLSKISKEMDYEFLMITNQDGLGTDSFPAENFWPAHNKMLEDLKAHNTEFKDILIDESFEKDNSPNRKPRTGLMAPYINGNYDLVNSYVIGDRLTDVELAKNIGAKAILIKDTLGEDEQRAIEEKGLNEVLSLTTGNWEDIYRFLQKVDDE